MVPLLTVPGASASSCIFRILNVKDPCPSGMRIDKANYIYVGGRATVGFVDLYPQPGIASRITFPGGSVRDGGDIVVDWVCTGGGRSASVYEWKGEIVLHDPSGTVFDAKNGRPVKAASLRLEFSPQRAGPFGTPGVSGIEPQVNPQLTSSNGLFGWNVADGYWRIRVRVFGYKPFTSPVYKVPPPVTGLKLKLVQDHVVRLESRAANIEGKGAVTIMDLVRNALRMRPERIVVGETRGGEALSMLQAMNTGHDGSLSTGHANSPRDILARLETMCLMAGVELPARAIREQIASALDLIIQISRLKDGSRKITNITEVQGMEGDTIVLQDVFVFEQTGFVDGKVQGRLRPTGIRPKFSEKFDAAGIKLPQNVFGDMSAGLR
jgi:hypothetical protein